MKIIEPGHIYELDWLGEPNVLQKKLYMGLGAAKRLYFVNREDKPHPGTQTQEVLRALIDRTMHCDNCLRWPGNDGIIYHLRMALVLHEIRALGRKMEKHSIWPELVKTGMDGHFLFSHDIGSEDFFKYTSSRTEEKNECPSSEMDMENAAGEEAQPEQK